jgi:hypothetical protein
VALNLGSTVIGSQARSDGYSIHIQVQTASRESFYDTLSHIKTQGRFRRMSVLIYRASLAPFDDE